MAPRSRAGLPGPITRLRRDPLAAAAVVLVAVLAATAGGIHQSAQITVSGLVDAHWRGAYDILVRPAHSRLDLEATGGLVEPNFVGFAGTGGMTLADLAAVRAVVGVDLAAPIGLVGFIRTTAPVITIQVDHLPAKPTLFRLDLTSTTTDGLGRELVQREVGEILLGPPAPGDNAAASWVTDLGDIDASQADDGSWVVDIITKRALPGLAVPVIAVDPVAENSLLDGSAVFLAPLSDVATSGRTAGTFDFGLIPNPYGTARGLVQSIQGGPASSPDRAIPVVPLVASDRRAADLRTELTVEQVGSPLDAYPAGPALQDAEAAAGTGVSSIGTASADLGISLAPFRSPALCVLWPGSKGPCADSTLFASSSIDRLLTARPSYATPAGKGPDPGAPSYRIAQTGWVNADGDPTAPDFRMTDSATSGEFPTYRLLQKVPMAVGRTVFVPHANIREPFVLAPVGTFDATAVTVPHDPLDYVPIGAYDPADTTYIADPSGSLATPTPMSYPLVAGGLVTTPPLAVTDLAGAQVLRGDAPIDAVRVRVAGVTDFGPASQARIAAVAGSIGRLGFDVDIVAGSSPQSVDVYVPQYSPEKAPPGDLGWVRQHWTTLGAADRITSGFELADLALLALSLVSGAIWAFALATLRAERRARDAAILASLGWRRLEIVRWLTADTAVAAVSIAILAVLGFVVGGGSREALGVALAMAAVWLAAGIVAAVDAVRRARPSALATTAISHRLGRGVAVRGASTYAVRAVLARWPWVAATAVGVAAAATSVTLGTALVTGLGARIGPTLLASAADAAAGVYQPLMLAAIGLGSLVFVAAALRLDRRRRAGEAVVLSVSGWAGGEIRWLLWSGLVPVAIGGAALAGLATALLAGSFNVGSPLPLTVIAAVVAASVLVWGEVLVRGVAASPGEVA